MSLTIVFISLFNFAIGVDDITPEQVAIDYFFENIFLEAYSDIKIIEFNQETKLNDSFAFFYNCEIFIDEKVKNNLKFSDGKSVKINAQKCHVKSKKIKKRSAKIKVEVYSWIEYGNQGFVYITVYKRLHFVEHHILTLDSKTFKVLDNCHFSEII